MPTRALRNVWRKKVRTILVVLALGFTIGSIASVYAGIDSTNTNTRELIDNSSENTQQLVDNAVSTTRKMINATINDTERMIGSVVNNTQNMIDDTLASTQEMIESTEQSFDEMENESEIQMTKITVSNMTGSRPPSYSEIQEYIIDNISGLEGVADIVPRIEKSYGNNMDPVMPPTRQGPGGGGGQRPQGGYSRMKADYVIEGIPLEPSLTDRYHLLPLDIIEGGNLVETDSMLVLIHRDLVDYFNASVGDNVTIEDTEFTVTGIYYSALQNTTVYMNISDAREMLGLDEGSSHIIDVYAENVSVVNNLTDEIGYWYPDFQIEAFKDSYASSAEYVERQQEMQVQRLNQDAQTQIDDLENSRDVQIAELELAREEQITQLEKEKDEQVAQIEKDRAEQVSEMEDDKVLLDTIGALIIIVSAISACIIIIVMMFYTVRERKREIGIFKALGFTGKSIVGQFVIEGIVIGLLGGLLGIGISVGLGPFFTDLVFPSSEVYIASRPGEALVMTVICITALLGALGSLFPAWGAARKRAAEAIRNE